MGDKRYRVQNTGNINKNTGNIIQDAEYRVQDTGYRSTRHNITVTVKIELSDVGLRTV